MAELLGEPPSTVASWKATGRIPATKQPLVLAAAAAHEIDVVAHDVVFPLAVRSDLVAPTPVPFTGQAVRLNEPLTFDRSGGAR